MDVMLKGGSSRTPQQFQRLLALLSCFSTVLQSAASGLLEMNLLQQIIEPLYKQNACRVIGMVIYVWTQIWIVRMDWGFMAVLDSLGRNIM
jgi:hypothetical protein